MLEKEKDILNGFRGCHITIYTKLLIKRKSANTMKPKIKQSNNTLSKYFQTLIQLSLIE